MATEHIELKTNIQKHCKYCCRLYNKIQLKQWSCNRGALWQMMACKYEMLFFYDLL